MRQEVLQTQKIRSQVIGVKITFVTASVSLILAHQDKVQIELLAVPAFASVFFDLLINSYSVSIARIGAYCRSYLEPILRKNVTWPDGIPLWEEFMATKKTRSLLGIIGNLGLSALVVILGIFSLVHANADVYHLLFGIALTAFFLYDMVVHFRPGRIQRKDWQGHQVNKSGARVETAEQAAAADRQTGS